jgi:hypothetical protein
VNHGFEIHKQTFEIFFVGEDNIQMDLRRKFLEIRTELPEKRDRM